MKENINTGENSTSDGTPPLINPARQLLELASGGKVTDVYLDGTISQDVFRVFIQGVLAHVVTKTKWNVHAHMYDMGTFVNVTDEAFAMVLLENNCDVWMDMVDEPQRNKRDRPRPRYLDKREGWSREGLLRFATIAAEIDDWKRMNGGEYNRVKESVRLIEQNSDKGSAAKKRKGPDSIDVISRKSARSKEDERVSAFLMSGGNVEVFKAENEDEGAIGVTGDGEVRL